MFARLLFAAAVALAAPAAAQDLTETERRGFAEATGRYQAAYRAGDAVALAVLMPPSVVARMVGEDVGAEARRDAIVAIVKDRLGRETSSSFKTDPDQAQFAKTPAGVHVGLIPMVNISIRRDGEPTEVRRPVNGRMQMVKLVTEYETTVWSHLLGIYEDGNWYLVSLIDADAVEALFEVYPIFKERGLPRARSQMHARTVRVE